MANFASPTCALAKVDAAPLSRPSPTREVRLQQLMLHGGATEEIGPTLWKAPAFDYAGAIGKRNQASERWLPHVSQQGRSSTTPDAPLWLRGNDSKEWKRLRGGRVIPEPCGRVRTAWGKPRQLPKTVLNAPGSRTLRRWLALWQGRTVRRVAS